jgi:hypothetical protein
MSQSQTRRKGTEILRDEINSIIGVVRAHSENLTRRLEKVRDLTVKYCAEKGRSLPGAASASAPAPAPAAAAAPVTRSRAPLPMAPPPTILPGVLNTIPEVNESNESMTPTNVEPGSPSVPLASQLASQAVPRSKGPVPWTMFRSKLAEGTNLKTGKTNTMKQVSALWEKAKAGNSVGNIEKYLRNELKIEPAVAAQKAPELEKIARNAAGRMTSKKPVTSRRVSRSLGAGGALTVENVATPAAAAAAAAPPKSRRASKVTSQANAPINPNKETDNAFWERMNAAAVKDAENKTAAALALPAQREAARAEAARRVAARNAQLAATPLKNRNVPLASPLAQIPTLVPTSNNAGKIKVTNPTTGEEEDLSL